MSTMKGISSFEQGMIYFVLATAFLALGYAYWLARKTFAADKGTPSMQEIWGHIRDGRQRLSAHADEDNRHPDRHPDRGHVRQRGPGTADRRSE